MEKTRYADSHNDSSSDSGSSSSSTDSVVHAKTTPSRHTYNTTTSSATTETTSQDSRPREVAAESDGDDTSSDSSIEDGNVTKHTTADINTRIPTERAASKAPRDITTQEEVYVRPSPVTIDKALVAKKEASRLSARLGLMSIVDSVVVRKKLQDRLPENVLYDEIGKLVTDSTDEVEADQGDDDPAPTDNHDTKPPTPQSPTADNQSSKSNDSDGSSNTSVPSDQSVEGDGVGAGTPARIEVSQGVVGKATYDLEEVELNNVVESRDYTPNDDSNHGAFFSCCCFR